MAAIYTFLDLVTEVLTNLDEAENTDTQPTLAKQFINQAHLMRCSSRDWPFMKWPYSETFSLVAGQRVYPLHEEYWKPYWFRNRTTGDYLREIPQRGLVDSGVMPYSDTGSSSRYQGAGYSSVRNQPTSSSVITISSSSALDTSAAQAITVYGVTSSGLTASESITPNGTTPVASTTSFRPILDVTKAANWTGTMTMTSNSAAVTNLVLGPTEFGRMFPQIELMASPTATDTVEYRFWRQPRKLVNDNDIPNIPPPHSLILVWDALLLYSGYLTDISDKSMATWRAMQQTLDLQMLLNFREGMALNAEMPMIHEASDNDIWTGPRVQLGS